MAAMNRGGSPSERIRVACGCGAVLMAKQSMIGSRAKCPKCGLTVLVDEAITAVPVLDVAPPVYRPPDHVTAVTIEKTSKHWKALQLKGMGLTLLGFPGILCLAGASDAGRAAPLVMCMGFLLGICSFYGVFLYVTAYIGAWWDHG